MATLTESLNTVKSDLSNIFSVFKENLPNDFSNIIAAMGDNAKAALEKNLETGLAQSQIVQSIKTNEINKRLPAIIIFMLAGFVLYLFFRRG